MSTYTNGILDVLCYLKGQLVYLMAGLGKVVGTPFSLFLSMYIYLFIFITEISLNFVAFFFK